jgi:iron only hydrogenase large subunit-like protein
VLNDVLCCGLQDPNKDEPLPMFTSCCPGWVAMVEKSNPELIPYLSTCKSPQMMLGAMIKNYFAQETGKAPTAITNVSVMPCVRKQGEADREWFNTTGKQFQPLSSFVIANDASSFLVPAGP